MPFISIRQIPCCVLLLAAGCVSKPPVVSPTPVEAVQPTSPPTASDSIFDRPMQRYTVEFTVHRITAPKGAFTQDGGVWKLVTGSLTSARATLRLAANGIRVAIGQESDRASLLAELTKLPEPRIALDHAQPDVNRTVDLELGPCAPQLAVFHYDEAGGIHGRDFSGAVGRIKMSYEMRAANLQEVLLEIVPELEEPPGPLRWVQSPEGNWMQKPEERKTTYTDLAFQARIGQGGFLLIGPMASVYDQSLLAKALFIQEGEIGANGQPQTRESIFVISPLIRSDRSGPNKETAAQARGPS